MILSRAVIHTDISDEFYAHSRCRMNNCPPCSAYQNLFAELDAHNSHQPFLKQLGKTFISFIQKVHPDRGIY